METQKFKKIIITIGVVLLIMVLGYVVFLELEKAKRINETKKISNEDTNTPYEVKSILESKISFPNKVVKDTKELNSQAVEENNIFILDGGEGLSIKEETYNDGSKGLNIYYTIKQDMKNVYITLRNTILRENFATSSATRANIGAILMAENDSSIYKVYLQNNVSGETEVNLRILNK
ncbi:MAG TPA: hypothetical protein PLZ99_01130 [Parcubacteria group bacterium]|jgi:hypothetical protein|nr:hypothetical protein [Parcubacteria group bacterium]